MTLVFCIIGVLVVACVVLILVVNVQSKEIERVYEQSQENTREEARARADDLKYWQQKSASFEMSLTAAREGLVEWQDLCAKSRKEAQRLREKLAAREDVWAAQITAIQRAIKP